MYLPEYEELPDGTGSHIISSPHTQRLQPGSDPLKAELGMSRQEMASLLGVHRISLYKVLRQQEENGMFGPFTRDNITILQPEVFFKLVES